MKISGLKDGVLYKPKMSHIPFLMQVLEVVFQFRWENYTHQQFYNLNLDLHKTTYHSRFYIGFFETYYS